MTPPTITTELIERTDGSPVAYIDATAVAVFAYERPDGSYLIDVYTRNDSAGARLRLDGQPLTAVAPARHRVCATRRAARPRARCRS